MKKKIFVVASITIIVGLIIAICNNELFNNRNDVVISKTEKYEGMVSMMLETSNGSGKYEETTSSKWPTDGYAFNTSLSKCENGGDISWNDTKKIVVMMGNSSDKCYIYFDRVSVARYDETCNDETLSCYIAKLYTGTQGDNNIYYHDQTLDYSANDESYRYAGIGNGSQQGDEYINGIRNIVCFNPDVSSCTFDDLYRIIGIFKSDNGYRVKLIKFNYINDDLLGTDGSYGGTSQITDHSFCATIGLCEYYNYYWNASDNVNNWAESNLNTINLNTNFLANIDSTIRELIDINSWYVGGNTYDNLYSKNAKVIYDNEMAGSSVLYKSKVGLMYISDYFYASSPDYWALTLDNDNSSAISSANWLFLKGTEATITRISDSKDSVWYVKSNGGLEPHYASNYGALSVVRPVFYLNANAKYVDGDGSLYTPYQISI